MFPVFMLRLALAGLLGALIGLEREYRAKEAGIRTNFLVATGSALIMIASQWGFTDLAALQLKVDGSRVAAQIVSGIGFIGAGTIMMHKEFVRGLTTAAALWVAAGVGIAVGGGLYAVGISGTLLAIIGIEVLPKITGRFRRKSSIVHLSAETAFDLRDLIGRMSQEGFRLLSYEVEPHKKLPGLVKVRMVIREYDRGDEGHLITFLQQFDGLNVDRVE
ncbi:MAG: MgtC/SapB family protein [Lentisphaeria bacterium]|nr:MgtC/SapB family protein [Lentisphaeria bacterium]